MIDPRTPEGVDRSRINWKARSKQLAATLERLWQNRRASDRVLRMAFDVETHRQVLWLRAHFDKKGWTLRSQTELKSATIALWITQRYRGARPARVAA